MANTHESPDGIRSRGPALPSASPARRSPTRQPARRSRQGALLRRQQVQGHGRVRRDDGTPTPAPATTPARARAGCSIDKDTCLKIEGGRLTPEAEEN